MFSSSELVPALNGGAGGSSVRTQPNSQKSAWTSEAFWDTTGFCLFSKFQKNESLSRGFQNYHQKTSQVHFSLL